MAQEAVRRDALPAACPLLAVPPAVQPPPRSATHQTRQGSPAGIQGQAGWVRGNRTGISHRNLPPRTVNLTVVFFPPDRLRYLPHPCAPWWPQAPGAQGRHLWQASAPWRQPDQVCPQLAVHCWGMDDCHYSFMISIAAVKQVVAGWSPEGCCNISFVFRAAKIYAVGSVCSVCYKWQNCHGRGWKRMK